MHKYQKYGIFIDRIYTDRQLLQHLALRNKALIEIFVENEEMYLISSLIIKLGLLILTPLLRAALVHTPLNMLDYMANVVLENGKK